MRLSINVTLDYWFNEPTDTLLSLQAAAMLDQTIIESTLALTSSEPILAVTGGSDVGIRNWTTLDRGQNIITYQAVVDVERSVKDIRGMSSSRLPTLPANVIPFIWPSRYCEADRFHSFINSEFTNLSGGNLVYAILDWVRAHLTYSPGCSDATTTAVDTFISRRGICRDYAHLTATLVRAADIPARLVSVYALDINQPDFHAVVEVWLEGAWHIIDATDLAPIETMVRIAAGRDATDIAYMTTFGEVQLNTQSVMVTRAN